MTIVSTARWGRLPSPAPLFDHGNSLLNFASSEAVTSEKAIKKYAAAQMPCVYDDFIEEAKTVFTHEHRNNLRKLLAFQFKRHRLYNLPEQRLELIEAVVHEQARKLLKER